jgi:chemotaxis methyl-accepting protein methylase
MAPNFALKYASDAGKVLWELLPVDLRERPPLLGVGSWIHNQALKFSSRTQSGSTWFLRNEALLLTIRDIVADNAGHHDPLRLCVVGCSTGAEIYSILWTLRKAQPDLKILPIGIDISEAAIAEARAGCYSLSDSELTGGFLNSHKDPVLSEKSIRELFDKEGNKLKIKNWIAEGVQWVVGDAQDPDIVEKIGIQDMVVANNFLIHMQPPQALACLSNIVRLVRPGGYLVFRGVDLEVREQAVLQLGLRPIELRIEEIHNSDPDLDARHHWPWRYYGLEPLDKTRKNWIERYAAVFQVEAKP